VGCSVQGQVLYSLSALRFPSGYNLVKLLGVEMAFTKHRRSFRRFAIALLIIELCGLSLLEWPLLYNFNKFAFWDWGGYLVAHYLVHQGRMPVTDFTWQYGLLPLFLQELWFHLVAAGPASFVMLSFPCAVLLTLAIGSFANLESNTAGVALAMLSLPFVIALGSDLPHAFEPVLLSVGLLLQAQGKRSQSLAFATAACFTKPVMGYFYGLILLIFVLFDLHREDRLEIAALSRALVPAVLTGLGLAVLLGITFGWTALFRSLLPLSGAHAYRVLHYGWTGIARGLFYFPGMRLTYYVGTPVTFWLCATLYLVAAAMLVGWRILQRRIGAPDNYEIVLTCALLHVVFLGFFYGAPASWTYYAYILVMGVIATAAWTPASARFVWGLCILAAIGNYGLFKSSIVAWKTMKPSNVTAGLFALPTESAEWSQVTSMVLDKNPELFTWDGGAEMLFPWLRKPVGAFIVPGEANGKEIQQKVQQLRSAEAVIIPTIPELGNSLTTWPGPEFQTVLDDTTLKFKGVYFEVFERAAAVGGTGS
jgi:hypothetical protein